MVAEIWASVMSSFVDQLVALTMTDTKDSFNESHIFKFQNTVYSELAVFACRIYR